MGPWTVNDKMPRRREDRQGIPRDTNWGRTQRWPGIMMRAGAEQSVAGKRPGGGSGNAGP